jgi:energy-coupling factor transport system permease protein
VSTVTVGSYYHGTSPLHRMDPRVKFLIMAVFMVSVFLAPAPWGLVAVAALLALMVALSRVPLRVVNKACKPLWFFVIFTAVVNILLVQTGEVAFHLGPFAIHDAALVQSVYMAFRMFALMMAGVMFSLVTSPIAITDGIERLLSPLERFGMPVHELAMMYTIAIRFVPTLFDEANHIMTAQASRGASLDEGRLIDRVRIFVPILVPLFASALRHAEELANAMEARCYTGGAGRTHYHVLKIRRTDVAGICVFAVYLAVLVLLKVLIS